MIICLSKASEWDRLPVVDKPPGLQSTYRLRIHASQYREC